MDLTFPDFEFQTIDMDLFIKLENGKEGDILN